MEDTSAAGIFSRCCSLLSFLWGPASSEKEKEPYSAAGSPLEESLEGILSHHRGSGHPLPCSLSTQLLSQGNPGSEQSVRALTATHTWASAASHKTVQRQEKSPTNVKLKKAAAPVSIFGMNWRILLFQLQPTCWFSSAALLFCSFPFPGLS